MWRLSALIQGVTQTSVEELKPGVSQNMLSVIKYKTEEKQTATEGGKVEHHKGANISFGQGD